MPSSIFVAPVENETDRPSFAERDELGDLVHDLDNNELLTDIRAHWQPENLA